MPNDIIARYADTTAALVSDYAATVADVIADYQQRMTMRDADLYMHVRQGMTRGLIESGLIDYYKINNRYYVTPRFIAQYLESIRQRNPTLPEAEAG